MKWTLVKDEVLGRVALWNGNKIVASMSFSDWTHLIATLKSSNMRSLMKKLLILMIPAFLVLLSGCVVINAFRDGVVR